MHGSSCFCTRLRAAARALTRTYDRALSPAGLKAAQFALLRVVVRLGRAKIARIADATGLDRSTLGRNLRVLRRMGLVTFSKGDDERATYVAATARGEAALDAALPLWEATQARMDALVGAKDKARLFALLSALERTAS